ncbi:hypothetical protein [Streptomyces anandii]|uniref:hypothetical protein n=1 Tax=Streptomyces anandii TaxID=285454 RepID=UPI001672030A|nr:hypothetical protein [Streptomyces anandii]GGX89808.1 hypothetical protein GCM10010510_38850 [Streptomyces anandii JCM 4720]
MIVEVGEVRRRLLRDVFAAGEPYGLALGGGHAVQAHGLVGRVSRDVEFATESPAATGDIAAAVGSGLAERGWRVRPSGTEALAARLVVGDPASGEECAVQILKEVLWRPVESSELGPVLSLEDLVGTRVRALAGQGLAPDLVDVHAAAARWSHPELEELGRRHSGDAFDLTDLQTRLVGAEWLDDREFTAYGLDDHATTELRRWAQQWADDIGERLLEADTSPEAPGTPEALEDPEDE